MDPNSNNAGSTVSSASVAGENQSATPVTPQPAVTPGATNGIPQPSPSTIAAMAAPSVPAGAPTVPPVTHKGKSMMWVVILLIFAFFCGLLLAVWYFQTQLQRVSQSDQTAQAPVTTLTKIVIGTDATFPPMEYTASEEALMGYDVDLGNRIGKELGVQVSYKNIPWDDLFLALENKEVDMIISSVTITEERKQKYDFSEQYLNAGQVIITRADDTSITSPDDLKGKKIAVQEETTNETEALKLTDKNFVIRYPDFLLATEALVEGEADAILSDLPGAKGIITENPTLKIASDPFTNEHYGIVFRKGDPNIAKINEILSSLRTQGVLTDLKQKWLD